MSHLPTLKLIFKPGNWSACGPAMSIIIRWCSQYTEDLTRSTSVMWWRGGDLPQMIGSSIHLMGIMYKYECVMDRFRKECIVELTWRVEGFRNCCSESVECNTGMRYQSQKMSPAEKAIVQRTGEAIPPRQWLRFTETHVLTSLWLANGNSWMGR